MGRSPSKVPNGYDEPEQRNYPWWLPHLSSLALLAVPYVVLSVIAFDSLVVNPRRLITDLYATDSLVLASTMIFSFLLTVELHEQTHRITAYMLGLDPTYRRWIPTKGGGYVLIQERWVSRDKMNIMTIAPFVGLNFLALLTFFVAPQGLLKWFLFSIFTINTSLAGKDIIDVVFNLSLDSKSRLWVSDLGDEAVEYYVQPAGE